MIHNKVHEKTDSLIYLFPLPLPLVPCSPSFSFPLSFPPRSLRSDVKAAPILLQDRGKNRINCNSVCICNSVVCIVEHWSQVVHLIKLGMNYRTLADTVQLCLPSKPTLPHISRNSPSPKRTWNHFHNHRAFCYLPYWDRPRMRRNRCSISWFVPSPEQGNAALTEHSTEENRQTSRTRSCTCSSSVRTQTNANKMVYPTKSILWELEIPRRHSSRVWTNKLACWF